MTVTEKVILLNLISGDMVSFDAIYHRYSNKLYSFSFSLSKDPEQADEMVQDVFVSIWEKREQINPDLPFENYLITICSNSIRKFFRRKKIENKVKDYLLKNIPESITETSNTVGFEMDWVYDKTTQADFQKNTLWYGENDDHVGLNWVEMRYAEVLLNVAEALIMQDKYAEAALYINQVRKRARDYALADPGRYYQVGLADDQILPEITISDRAGGLDRLRYEKRVEFADEDKRGFDLRRWGIEEQTWAAETGYTWDNKLHLLPIPQDALD